jgi:hypothetical protein
MVGFGNFFTSKAVAAVGNAIENSTLRQVGKKAEGVAQTVVYPATALWLGHATGHDITQIATQHSVGDLSATVGHHASGHIPQAQPFGSNVMHASLDPLQAPHIPHGGGHGHHPASHAPMEAGEALAKGLEKKQEAEEAVETAMKVVEHLGNG